MFYPGEIAYSDSANRELSNDFSDMVVQRKKVAGPALFRGRLKAFGKCTNWVASSKGRQNLESVRLTVWGKRYFTPVLTCSNLSKTFHTCLQLFTPFPTCSHLFTPVHTCSHLFTPIYTCSQLFITVHTCSYLSTPH